MTSVRTGRVLGAVVRRGLRDQRRAVLTWGGAMAAYGGFLAAIYPSISSAVAEAIESYPAGLKEAFGIETLDTVEAYLHAEMFSLIVPLALGFFVVHAVARAVVGAEERGYLDTILALPLSRRTLAAGTLVVTALALAAVLAIMGAATWAVGRLAGTGISAGLTAAGAFGVWPLGMLLAGLSMLGAGVLHRAATVTGLAMGALVAMYVLDLAARLADSVAFLRWASVFHYAGAPMRDGIDPLAFVGLTAAGLALAALGAALFERRDVLR